MNLPRPPGVIAAIEPLHEMFRVIVSLPLHPRADVAEFWRQGDLKEAGDVTDSLVHIVDQVSYTISSGSID